MHPSHALFRLIGINATYKTKVVHELGDPLEIAEAGDKEVDVFLSASSCSGAVAAMVRAHP